MRAKIKNMATTMKNMVEKSKVVESLDVTNNRFMWSFPSARNRTHYAEWANYIRTRMLPDTKIFLDTCFVTKDEIPSYFWDALLTKKVVFTPRVWNELSDWFKNPRRNVHFRDAVAEAKAQNRDSVWFADYTGYKGKDACIGYGIGYYTQLLATRKLDAQWLVEDFVRKNGREPSKDERLRLFQRPGDERGNKLRIKGFETRNSPNFATDEELVAFAVIDSLDKGTDVLLLTKDNDVFDQFYKLTMLLDIHYKDMLFADWFSKNACSLNFLPMPDTQYTREFFDPETSIMVEKPEGIHQKLLPPYKRLPLWCVLFGGDAEHPLFTPMYYNADKDMHRLCVPKMLTAGLSTHLLHGRNCHSCNVPEGIDKKYALITKDHFFIAAFLKISRLDVSHAIYYREKPVIGEQAFLLTTLTSNLSEMENQLQKRFASNGHDVKVFASVFELCCPRPRHMRIEMRLMKKDAS